jgi:hypothetical protein
MHSHIYLCLLISVDKNIVYQLVAVTGLLVPVFILHKRSEIEREYHEFMQPHFILKWNEMWRKKKRQKENIKMEYASRQEVVRKPSKFK